MRGRAPAPRMWAMAAVVLLLVTACSGHTRLPPGGGTGGAATFTMAYPMQVMTNWDPATSQSNEIIAMSNMYEQLTRYDAVKKKVVPRLATSWTSSADGLVWTFRLRPGVTFHNGAPMTAASAKAAFDRTIQLDLGAAYIWDPVKQITAPDATTLVFTLKYAAPLDLIATSGYGAYVYDTQAARGADLAAWFGKGNDAGTGPYRAAQWNRGQETELRLSAYQRYWGGWRAKHFARMVFRVVPEATTAAQLLASGEISYAGDLTPQLWRQAARTESVATTKDTSFQTLVACLNTKTGPMADDRVRRAFMLALDYHGLNRALFGSSSLASGYIPPGLLGYRAGLGPAQNLAEARKLLKAAGYGPGGNPLTVTLTRTQGDKAAELAATIWQSTLAELGVDLRVRALAWESQWDQGKNADPNRRQDILLMYWFPDYADPISWFVNLFHSEPTPAFNLSYFADPAVDQAIDTAPQLTVTNRPAADHAYVELQKTLLDNAVTVPVLVSEHQRAILKSIGGYVDNPAYNDVVFAHDLVPGVLS